MHETYVCTHIMNIHYQEIFHDNLILSDIFVTFPTPYNLNISHLFTRYAHLDDYMPMDSLKISE